MPIVHTNQLYQLLHKILTAGMDMEPFAAILYTGLQHLREEKLFNSLGLNPKYDSVLLKIVYFISWTITYLLSSFTMRREGE